MSFQNQIAPDGININVIPSFGRIVTVPETEKTRIMSEIDRLRHNNRVLHVRPPDFNPTRYVSFSTRETVEEVVDANHIHDYVEKSRLSKRLGF